MECKGIDAKGVETERKDTLPFLKKIYMDVRNELMYNKDAYAALKQLEKHLWCLVRNEVPFEDLILSKGLRGTYKDESTLVQCCVNEKKRLRQPGSESAVGDRVWYVIVNGPLGSKTTDLAEDPAYVKEHNLKLNRLWYFEHAIEKPMASLFSHIKQVNANPLFATIKAELERERVGGTSLRGLVDASVASSSMDTSIVGVKHHVPRPPPPLVRKKKKN
jgi:DNA polymerase elongation subunit (family B)